MMIQEAIDKANEGGYHMHGSDGMETSYDGANNEFSGWTRKDNLSTFLVPTEETFVIAQPGSNKERTGESAFWMA